MRNRIAVIGRGAVGSAIFNDLNSKIDGVELYHSQNIDELLNNDDKEFELIIYAAVPGIKWKANLNPDEDFKIVQNAFEQIKQLKTKCMQFILISTIDALYSKSGAYGKNRKWLEDEVLKELSLSCAIVQLPAIKGSTVKKNIWFDLMHPYPESLNQSMCDKLNQYAQKKLNSNEIIYEIDSQNHLTYHRDLVDLNNHQLGLYNATHPYSKMLWLDISNLGDVLLTEEFIKFGDKTLIASYYKNEPALLSTYELFEIIYNEKFIFNIDRLEYDKLLNYVDYSQFANNATFVNNIKF